MKKHEAKIPDFDLKLGQVYNYKFYVSVIGL
jgi:hypothetical protein